jgi:hypothetical protein
MIGPTLSDACLLTAYTAVLVTSVPPACMNLATILTSNPAHAGGPVPIPMGSDSLQYNGLTGDDRRNLANALGA